jgi:hypothetical protein
MNNYRTLYDKIIAELKIYKDPNNVMGQNKEL